MAGKKKIKVAILEPGREIDVKYMTLQELTDQRRWVWFDTKEKMIEMDKDAPDHVIYARYRQDAAGIIYGAFLYKNLIRSHNDEEFCNIVNDCNYDDDIVFSIHKRKDV